NKEGVSVNLKPKVWRLYNKVEKINKEEEDAEEFIKVFARSVLRMYEKTFVTSSNEPSKELNRHSIAHGFHDYDSIEKIDILKLFQLLKSSLILKNITIDEFK